MTAGREIAVPEEAEWIIEKIREHGFEAFVVGGCVRDSLLGREPEDWDITTSAEPEQVKAIFRKTLDTGLKHGTVTVMKNHRGYEVTTYRIDGEYRDGRHPESVSFTKSLLEDLKRRDFTINAMAYSRETGIVDEFHGMEDLRDGVIRCVGCAHDRFTEDALRILRAIRFSAQLGFSIEEETYRAIAEIAPNLGKVSRERVQAELTKLLLSEHTERILCVEETGISPFVAEGFAEIFKGEPSFAELALLPREKSMRWAGLLRGLSPEAAREILRALKLDNDTIANARGMIACFQTPPEPEKPAVRRALSRMKEYQFDGALRLLELSAKTAGTAAELRRLWDEIKRDGDCVSLRTMAIDGGDLVRLGVRPGKELGELLMRLFEVVLKEPALNQRDFLLEYAKLLLLIHNL